MQKIHQRLVTALLILSGLTFTAAASETQSSLNKAVIDITTDVFDGYSGVEVTEHGLLGYNYALSVPNGEDILLGFDPRNSSDANTEFSYLDIAQGWDIKLPQITGSTFVTSRGIKVSISEIDISMNQGKYVYEEGYGRETTFSSAGLIQSVVDEFDNTTTYNYVDGKISKITYNDHSVVSFNHNGNSLSITYSCNGEPDLVLASFNIDSENKLSSITAEDETLLFEYDHSADLSTILLASCELQDEYTKSFSYVECMPPTGEDYHRVTEINTFYAEGMSKTQSYSYDAQYQLDSVSFENGFLIEYEYSTDANGNKSVQQTKHTPSNISVTSYTKNDIGQITNYVSGQTELQIEYNNNNRIESINDNGTITTYTYNNMGLPALSTTSNGVISQFVYNDDGVLIEKRTNDGDIVYFNNDLQSTISVPASSSNNLVETPLSRASWSVQYNINSSVGVTNFMASYGLNEGACNCYGFAMAKYTDNRDPGYFAGKYYGSMLKDNLNTLKIAVEEDVDALGRYAFDCGISDSFTSHQWKIAMRIRTGYDYHFMKQSYQGPWMFKAGSTGPVMQLLSNRTPQGVSWDTYSYNVSTSRYQVEMSGCYNSSIYYMIIEG